jgi:hypothetical protein
MSSKPESLDDLLRTKITWIKVAGRPVWYGSYLGRKCELTMNNFPEEPLYTLKWDGLSVDFDESPSVWVLTRN